MHFTIHACSSNSAPFQIHDRCRCTNVGIKRKYIFDIKCTCMSLEPRGMDRRQASCLQRGRVRVQSKTSPL